MCFNIISTSFVVVRKLQGFESPFIALLTYKGTHQLVIRKKYVFQRYGFQLKTHVNISTVYHFLFEFPWNGTLHVIYMKLFVFFQTLTDS